MLNNDEKKNLKERLKLNLDKIKNFKLKSNFNRKPLKYNELVVEVNSKDVDYISNNEKSASSRRNKNENIKRNSIEMNNNNERKHLVSNRSSLSVNEYNYKWAIFTLKILVVLISVVCGIAFIITNL